MYRFSGKLRSAGRLATQSVLTTSAGYRFMSKRAKNRLSLFTCRAAISQVHELTTVVGFDCFHDPRESVPRMCPPHMRSKKARQSAVTQDTVNIVALKTAAGRPGDCRLRRKRSSDDIASGCGGPRQSSPRWKCVTPVCTLSDQARPSIQYPV